MINNAAPQTQNETLFTTTNTAQIWFQNGLQTVVNGTTFNGGISVNSGSLTVPVGNIAYNMGGFQLTGLTSAVKGSGTRVGVDGVFENDGGFFWNGGEISDLIFNNMSSASITITGSSMTLDSSLLTNSGYMEWEQGNITMTTGFGNCYLTNYGQFVIWANNNTLFDRAGGGFTTTILNGIDANGNRGSVTISGGKNGPPPGKTGPPAITTTIQPSFTNNADLNQGTATDPGTLVINNLTNNPGSTDTNP